jgi:hypothetical protein
MPRGGIVPPAPVLAPGSALGSRPRVALSSAQVPQVYLSSRARGKPFHNADYRIMPTETLVIWLFGTFRGPFGSPLAKPTHG